jgi:small subunit ribosomal protein S20
MANTASARKRIRQTAKRTERKPRPQVAVAPSCARSRAIAGGRTRPPRKEAVRPAQPELQRALTKGVLHFQSRWHA